MGVLLLVAALYISGIAMMLRSNKYQESISLFLLFRLGGGAVSLASVFIALTVFM